MLIAFLRHRRFGWHCWAAFARLFRLATGGAVLGIDQRRAVHVDRFYECRSGLPNLDRGQSAADPWVGQIGPTARMLLSQRGRAYGAPAAEATYMSDPGHSPQPAAIRVSLVPAAHAPRHSHGGALAFLGLFRAGFSRLGIAGAFLACMGVGLVVLSDAGGRAGGRRPEAQPTRPAP